MVFAVTTTGLRPDGSSPSSVPEVAWAIAAGTADAITTVNDPVVDALSDGLILGFRAAAANATATPTFAPDGLVPHTIVKLGGAALVPGDIPGALAECLVRYNLANTRWELLNPARPASTLPWVAAGGTADVITATYAPAVLALTDGLRLAFRGLGSNTVTTPSFSPNGLTAHTIVKRGSTALASGDIVANGEYVVRYNLANTRWVLAGPTVP